MTLRWLLQIDYINLTYTCSGLDVHEMREFLDEIGSTQVKIIAKVRQHLHQAPCLILSELHVTDSLPRLRAANGLSRKRNIRDRCTTKAANRKQKTCSK